MIDIDLKLSREQLGLTQSQFAKKIGETRQHVWEHEQGKRVFELSKKVAALRACGCDIEIIVRYPIIEK